MTEKDAIKILQDVRNPRIREAICTLHPELAESEEDDDFINMLILHFNYLIDKGGDSVETYKSYIKKLKSLRPQPHKEIYQAAKHDLAIRFMNYLDENRPEGKMGLSNAECEDIDKAFKENDWAKIMRCVEKYSPSWKPSEVCYGAKGYPDPAGVWKPSKEQMKALEECRECKRCIKELYEQLNSRN